MIVYADRVIKPSTDGAGVSECDWARVGVQISLVPKQ